jgi:hypothetical protein
MVGPIEHRREMLDYFHEHRPESGVKASGSAWWVEL